MKMNDCENGSVEIIALFLMIYDGMIPILWALFQLEGVTWCLGLLVPGERTLLLLYCSHLHVQIFPEKEI